MITAPGVEKAKSEGKKGRERGGGDGLLVSPLQVSNPGLQPTAFSTTTLHRPSHRSPPPPTRFANLEDVSLGFTLFLLVFSYWAFLLGRAVESTCVLERIRWAWLQEVSKYSSRWERELEWKLARFLRDGASGVARGGFGRGWSRTRRGARRGLW